MSDKIAVSLPERDNEFQQLQEADARSTAARLGLDAEVVYADNNAILQIQQIFKLIHADPKPRAIVVEPVASEGVERVAQKAASSGIGWCLLNATAGYLTELRRQFPALPIFALGSDQVEIGRIQGRQIKTLLPGGGTALYIQGPRGSTAAEERSRGLQEVLAGGQVRTILLDGQWTEESAERSVRNWLRLKSNESTRIDLVAGQDDSMARGARRAVEASPEIAKRWGPVPFVGIDGVPSVGQKMVQAGQLTATVVMPSNTGPALEELARWLKSGTLPAASVQVPVASYPAEDELRQRARKEGS